MGDASYVIGFAFGLATGVAIACAVDMLHMMVYKDLKQEDRDAGRE